MHPGQVGSSFSRSMQPLPFWQIRQLLWIYRLDTMLQLRCRKVLRSRSRFLRHLSQRNLVCHRRRQRSGLHDGQRRDDSESVADSRASMSGGNVGRIGLLQLHRVSARYVRDFCWSIDHRLCDVRVRAGGDWNWRHGLRGLQQCVLHDERIYLHRLSAGYSQCRAWDHGWRLRSMCSWHVRVRPRLAHLHRLRCGNFLDGDWRYRCRHLRVMPCGNVQYCHWWCR